MIFSITTPWSYMTLILFLTLVITLTYYICKFSARRTIIGYSALITAVAGLICCVLAVASYRIKSDLSVTSTLLFFYGIYISFAFVPGLRAFLIISRQMESSSGAWLSIFGFLWVGATIITGLVMAIITSVFGYRSGSLLFFYLSNWVLVAMSLIHHIQNYHRLEGKASKTITVYSSLNILSVVFFVIIAFPPITLSADITFILSLVFCELPIAIAMLIAVLNGYLWGDQIIVCSKLDYVETIV